ncbi:MAG: hypothetical protein OEU46_06860 [Alphaproteobacteria bacterium]|nr:hypothetical protein [Alphaproteobacteria bacterium]
MSTPDTPEHAAYRAAAEIHHRFLTGLILATVAHCGTETAAEAVYRLFKLHHDEKFLPGLKILGLTDLPDAVASAQYHYLSNFLGTVKVEYMPESDRKSWIRYPPPRWIFDGTAICAVPDAVTIGMMRGWHARNGLSLDNPRLGFVCTGMTTAGDAGLEGYFYEYDHDLEQEQRLRFAPDEIAPPFDAAAAPTVDVSAWPAERLAKAERNYSVDHSRSMLRVLIGLLGEDARAIAGRAGRQIGLQYYDATAALLGLETRTAEDFAEFLCRMLNALGDRAEIETVDGAIDVTTQDCRILRGVTDEASTLFDIWSTIWEGAAAASIARLSLRTDRNPADGACRWQIRTGG